MFVKELPLGHAADVGDDDDDEDDIDDDDGDGGGGGDDVRVIYVEWRRRFCVCVCVVCALPYVGDVCFAIIFSFSFSLSLSFFSASPCLISFIKYKRAQIWRIGRDEQRGAGGYCHILSPLVQMRK